MQNSKTKSMILTAFCIALGLVLPTAFHAIGAGNVFLPMHIPVLLCGLLCGWQYGAVCGFVVPLLSSLLTGMPPIFPVAPAMMLELCAYGCIAGLLYRGKFKLNLYVALAGAMLGGRIVSGIANATILGMAGKPYGFAAFITGTFVTALPGIILQLVALPVLVAALQKSGLMASPNTKQTAKATA